MAELHIIKNLADKRSEITAYIRNLQVDLEQAWAGGDEIPAAIPLKFSGSI